MEEFMIKMGKNIAHIKEGTKLYVRTHEYNHHVYVVFDTYDAEEAEGDIGYPCTRAFCIAESQLKKLLSCTADKEAEAKDRGFWMSECTTARYSLDYEKLKKNYQYIEDEKYPIPLYEIIAKKKEDGRVGVGKISYKARLLPDKGVYRAIMNGSASGYETVITANSLDKCTCTINIPYPEVFTFHTLDDSFPHILDVLTKGINEEIDRHQKMIDSLKPMTERIEAERAKRDIEDREEDYER